MEFQAKLDDDVKAGQTITVQRNMFGEVVAEYTTAVNGKLAAYRSDASSNRGNVLAFILFSQPGSPAQEGVHADSQCDDHSSH